MADRIKHCWHGNGPDDADCCICCLNPCARVTALDSVEHLRLEREQEREGWRCEMAYAIEHGHESPDPFAASAACPAGCRSRSTEASA